MKILTVNGREWARAGGYNLDGRHGLTLSEVLKHHLTTALVRFPGMHFLTLGNVADSELPPAIALLTRMPLTDFLNRIFLDSLNLYEGSFTQNSRLERRARETQSRFVSIPRSAPHLPVEGPNADDLVTAFGVNLDPIIYCGGFAAWQAREYRTQAA